MKLVPLAQLTEYVGRETGRSEWFTIDQGRIDRFADVTEDHQWIHVDRDAAAEGPFGEPIAHGFLTLSLLSHLNEQAAMLPEGAEMFINYGLDRLRFITPVRSGSRVRAVSTLSDVKDRGEGGVLVSAHVIVERLLDALKCFCHPAGFVDDVTIVLVKVAEA